MEKLQPDADFGRQLIDHLQTGVILLDRQGRIQVWNTWMTRHSRLTFDEVTGQRFDEAFPQIAGTRLQDAIEQALHFKLSSMLAPGLNVAVLPLYHQPDDRRLSRRMQQLVYVTPMRHTRYACLLQIQDMTATVRRERRLRAQSTQLIATTYRDALTGVGNRRRFDHDLASLFDDAQKRQCSIVMLMIDIDEFKAYNDRLGHPKGDECLIQVAETLHKGLRQPGNCLSRYGGEEFALLLPDTDRDIGYSIAERLRLAIEEMGLPHPASQVGKQVTVSIGVSAIVPQIGQASAVLIDQADQALYRAKNTGRNRCVYYGMEDSATPVGYLPAETVAALPLQT